VLLIGHLLIVRNLKWRRAFTFRARRVEGWAAMVKSCSPSNEANSESILVNTKCQYHWSATQLWAGFPCLELSIWIPGL